MHGSPFAVELNAAEQARMVNALRVAAGDAAAFELIETHISYVLVGADFAYKIKKALNVGFLDFSTLALRRHFCERELQLNRRLAPGLYLDLVPIAGTPDAPRLGGTGPPIDWAVRLRAFDQQGLWDRIAARGELREPQVDDLAEQLCRFHASAGIAPADSPFGRAEQVRPPMLDNLRVLRDLRTADAERALIGRLQDWEATEFAAVQGRFDERRRRGRVRECHGDLHLGNVATIEGCTTVFDCIEFNDGFRWIDVISEIAFMAMDLHHHGRPDLAHRFVDRYLERSGDYEGVRLLRYYLVYRALIRAKVDALRAVQAPLGGADAAARRHLELAARLAGTRDAALTITHGPSGSGKTTATQALLQARGAIRIRADVERKRLFGLEAAARTGSAPGAGIYSPAATAATYTRLLEAADAVVGGGWHALLDATFLARAQRDQARQWATARGVPFAILDFDTDVQTLHERVSARAARGGDASEADLEVLRRQLRDAEPLGADERPAVVRGPAPVAPRGLR